MPHAKRKSPCSRVKIGASADRCAADGKDARNKSSEKVKDDDRRKCYYCREAGHAKSQSRTRSKDLADAEWKPVTANSRPSGKAAAAPLAYDHVTLFLETTMRSDAGSTAPTGSECVKLISAISTCEICLMTDACAGGGICPEGSDQTAQRDTTVASTQFVTAPDDSSRGNVDETHFESHKFQVQCSEADVGFSISSAGKISQQSDWFELDEGYQVMLPGTGGQTTRTCAKDSNVAKLGENRRVYWLSGSAAECSDGAPLSMKFRVARLVVEARTDSETDFDATQLEESEETRRLKHKTIPRHVNRDKHDTRQIAHLQSRTRSGETVDQAHKPQAGTHEGEDTRGKDHLFLSNATDPQRVKAVLNRLESEAAFSAMSVNRVEARLVGACEAFRTRLNEMRAVQNTVCDTPKASSANAERIERASQMVEKRSRTSRSWFEGISVERVCKVMPDTVCNCAWQTSRRLARPGRAKQNEASRRHNGRVSKFTRMNHFTDGEWSLRLWRDAVMVSSGHCKGKLARVCRCRIVWRCPENRRLDRKPLTEMNGELWNTSPRQEEKLQIKDRECIALKHLIKCGGQGRGMVCCEHAGTNLWDLKARTQDIVDKEVVQPKNQRKFEPLTKKPTEEFEQGTVQSSTGGTAMAAGRPAPNSHMRLAVVAESATTQSTTSPRIRVVETEDHFNIECHKVLASRSDRHGTIEDMDTFGAIVLAIDPEDRDGWTQQVVDRNKKCCGTKSGHLGHT